MRTIMGIEIDDRSDQAVPVQELLTKHGCLIKTRLGLHATNENMCSQEGFLLLEIAHKTSGEFVELESELNALPGVRAKQMEF